MFRDMKFKRCRRRIPCEYSLPSSRVFNRMESIVFIGEYLASSWPDYLYFLITRSIRWIRLIWHNRSTSSSNDPSMETSLSSSPLPPTIS